MSATTFETPPTAHGIDAQRALALGRDVLATEAAAIRALEGRLGAAFLAAAGALFGCRGRVVVTGIGKSGHIARKLAATLASTGTPAFFVHAPEASHGDLGMITRADVVLAFSWSGETVELGSLVSYSRRFAVPLIAVTADRPPELRDVGAPQTIDQNHLYGNAVRWFVDPGVPDRLSWRALALAAFDTRGFSVEDFAIQRLNAGRRLLTHVRDVMRTGTAVSQARSRRRRRRRGWR
jgi:arabinose-5-phosphate isomerase